MNDCYSTDNCFIPINVLFPPLFCVESDVQLTLPFYSVHTYIHTYDAIISSKLFRTDILHLERQYIFEGTFLAVCEQNRGNCRGSELPHGMCRVKYQRQLNIQLTATGTSLSTQKGGKEAIMKEQFAGVQK